MLTKKEQTIALQLARETMAAFLENRSPKIRTSIPKGLMEKKGVFVTLTENGKLRGCIGNLENWQTVWEGIQENSLSASFNDPRFPPITKKELSGIRIEISVLSLPKPLEFHSPEELLQKLVPFEHGVILEKNGQRATFLPSVWEELSEKEQFLSHLCMKAGLEPTSWQDQKTKIWIYHAERFEEKQ
jgi:AmmeMemoRadiSam system protein A